MIIYDNLNNPIQLNTVFGGLEYKPHVGQELIHKDNSRFRYLTCGRRWGKTLFASKELFIACLKAEQLFWVVAPTYSLCEKVFREIYKDFLRKYPHWIEKASESMMKITLKNGTLIQAKSADNPESLLGEGLNGMIIDEAARIKDSVWQEYLRPTLSDKQGWLLAISTPKGQNWFYRGYMEGQKKINNNKSWNFTTEDNPYIAKEEIELARTTLPQRVFQQEYLGIFLGGVGGVFRNIRECIDENIEMQTQSVPGAVYVMGVDLAKYQDFTVITVIDKRINSVVYFDRFNTIDWTLQEKRIIDVWQKFNMPVAYIDATGVGDRVCEELQKTINNLVAVKFTGANKMDYIDELSLMLENKKIRYPDIPELIDELNIYEYEVTRSGNTKLNAPAGYHDDCVISLALAVQGIKDVGNYDYFGIA